MAWQLVPSSFCEHSPVQIPAGSEQLSLAAWVLLARKCSHSPNSGRKCNFWSETLVAENLWGSKQRVWLASYLSFQPLDVTGSSSKSSPTSSYEMWCREALGPDSGTHQECGSCTAVKLLYFIFSFYFYFLFLFSVLHCPVKKEQVEKKPPSHLVAGVVAVEEQTGWSKKCSSS